MDLFKNLFPISDFLYLLQLEEYESKRYFHLLPRFFFRRNFQKRGRLVYTKRIKITLAFALPFCIIFPLIPVWIGLANLILTPYFENIKLTIQERAAKYFLENFKGRVIAIAGSFGKTTTKNYIYELIKYNYKTQMIPGNINTPTGIANWVLTKLKKNTEILIVEMDTYFIGEIAKSCKITPPDIAILTNTYDQHLERLGSRANWKKALNEIFDCAKPNAIKIRNKKSNLDYVLEVAKILNIPKDIVNDTVKKLQKPDRRGDIKIIHSFETIDESYNISEVTARLALQNALSLTKKRKKKLIVITGGIPELGEENKDANINYGKLLSKSGAEVILLKTIFYKDLLKGLGSNVISASGMANAWETIQKKFSPKNHLVLMQPELGDQYY